MTKSFKMVLLEALQELDGWRTPPLLAALAAHSWQVLQRRRPLLGDLSDAMRALSDGTADSWQRYWRENPVNAWIGGNQPAGSNGALFRIRDQRFEPTFAVVPECQEAFTALVQELVDYRLAAYEVRRIARTAGTNVIPFKRPQPERTELAYFPNLRIACGHFKTGTADAEEHRCVGSGYGRLDPAHHFIARASGNSMNGGKNPIRDGDYLLLEFVTPSNAGSITGSVMAIERQGETGDNQYLLRVVTKAPDGRYILKANNPDYDDVVVTDEMRERLRTLARFKAVIDPLELAIGETFMREDIPALFGETFSPGNWNSGNRPANPS